MESLQASGRRLCEAAAAAFGLSPIRAAAVPQGFSGATVVRVECRRRGPLAVRAWPRGTDPARVASLHRFLRFVSDTAPLALPIADAAGRTAVECDGRLLQAEPWLPGVAAEPGRLDGALAVDVAARFAALQIRAAEYESADEWFAARTAVPLSLRQRLAAAASLTSNPPRPVGEEEVVAAGLLGLVREALAGAERPMPVRPCLQDVWSDGVLTDAGRVTGFIDLSAARCDDPAAAAARLFGSLAGGDRPLRDRLLGGYERHAPLDRGRVDLFDASGVVLSLLLWRRRIGRGEADGSDPRVARRVAALRERVVAAGALLRPAVLLFGHGRAGRDDQRP